MTTTSPDGAQNVRLCKVTILAPAQDVDLSFYDDVGDYDTNGAYVVEKGVRGRINCNVTPATCTDITITWKTKGGAVTVKNGVFYANKVSKKDKNTGEYIPDDIIVKCGKATRTLKMIVTE